MAKTAKIVRRYHTLLVQEPGEKWCIDFGSYERAEVEQEMADEKNNIGFGGHPTKTKFRIISTGHKETDIQAAVDTLNGIVAICDMRKHGVPGMGKSASLLTLPKVEAALAWAAQQTYYMAEDAAREYGQAYGREMVCDKPYYNAWAWRDTPKAKS